MIPYKIAIAFVVYCFLDLHTVSDMARADDSHISPYSLPEILTLAHKHSPVMTGVAAALEESQGRQIAAGAYLNPTVTGAAGRGSIRDPRTGVSIAERTITVEQPLEWPGKRSARQRAADAGFSGALAAIEEAKVTVTAEVKAGFYQLLFAQQDAQLAKENLRTVEDFVTLIRARVETKESPKFELVKATVELQKADKDLARAENALLVARANLNKIAGKALGERFAIHGEFEAPKADPDLRFLTEQAMARHPALRRQEKAVEQARFSLEHERAARIPNVSVIGQYHREAGDESIVAGLSVPVPLWYRRQGEIGTAVGTHHRAQAERLRIQYELEQAVTQYFQEMQTARRQIQVFERGLLYQAKEALDIAQFSFRNGVASLLEVIDAQRVYRQTLLESTQARAAYSLALARLEQAVGGLP
ncbi:TolC family protein [Candidatus Nitrospira nitrificans]|uniref:Putative Cation efflux system protein CzcC n=1 Tax=Candidatus Nitrospira nitrificans TaxID=1742973 RepID=A0A0S4LE54_9BACT|nr:TolC family protein [Candidatus Nitrospira nitrificans]CUS35900.1 putative Cation efflux system protein CzcC [Candidatus Nitrospira nitrificans]